MPRNARPPKSPFKAAATRTPPTGGEMLNDLYPSMCLARYGSEAAARQRYAEIGALLQPAHPLHWLFGDAEAKRRFARACAPARLHFIVTGSRVATQPHTADLCAPCSSART